MSEPRWPCPVCLGVRMDKVRMGGSAAPGGAGSGQTLTLDHCTRCGGMWFELGEVQRLRRERPETLWARVPGRDQKHRAQCHSCRAFLDRDRSVCGACGAKIQLACPACERPLLRVPRAGVTLDVCAACEGVWFDHHELDVIWKMERNAVATHGGGQKISEVIVDALLWANPDAAFIGAATAAHIADAAADTAPALLESVSEAAGNVFESLVEIVAGIFG